MKKSSKIWIYLLVLFGAFLLLASSCSKSGDNPGAQLPVVTTSNVTNVKSSTATCGGIIVSDGGSTVTARGVCWSTNTTPTIADSKTTDGAGAGTYTSELSNLQLGVNGTTFYVRAYATTSVGTGYGSAMSFTTKPGGSAGAVTDVDGNVYQTIIIGTQVWMVENLKTTKYRDGSPIPNVTDNSQWAELSTGAYCNYNNDAAIAGKYGKLYNWYAVSSTKKLAPAGWHIPTDAEWNTLKIYVSANLGSSGNIAKALAAKTDWDSMSADGEIGNNLTINNSSGFSALPGGYRSIGGSFNHVGYYCNWWSSSEDSTYDAWYRTLIKVDYNKFNFGKSSGFSVRCVRD